MWCTEHDLSDDLRRPLLAYRRRRLGHAVIGVVMMLVSTAVMIEQAVLYLQGLPVSDALPLQSLLAVVISFSGSVQIYRYWCWRKSL